MGATLAAVLIAREAAAVAVVAVDALCSDILLKHDIVLLGHLDNGIGFYRFSYNGSA